MALLCEKVTADTLIKDFLENAGFTFKRYLDSIVCCMCGFETRGTLSISHIQFMHKLLNSECEMVRYITDKYDNFTESKICIGNYGSAKKCVSETEEMMTLTFNCWPKRLPQVEKLVSAGFFYTGVSDELMCVECKTVLHDWETTDDPWIEHEKASPDCLLVRQHINPNCKK